MKRGTIPQFIVGSWLFLAAAAPLSAGCTRNSPSNAEQPSGVPESTPPVASNAAADSGGSTTPTAGNANGAQAQRDTSPLTPGAADPRDAALGAYIREVTQAVVHAATGQTVDPRFIAAHPRHHVAAIDPQDRALLAPLGNSLTVLGTEVEMDAIAQPSPNNHHQVLLHALVLPDGSVKWGTAGGRQHDEVLLDPTPGLPTQAPALNAAIQRGVQALAGTCALPWVAAADVASLPNELREEVLPDPATTHATCHQAQGVRGEWRGHVDDFRVFVSGNGHTAVLSSVFDVENADTDGGERLVLGPVHVQSGENAAPANTQAAAAH